MNFSKDTSSWFEGLQSILERVIDSPKTTVLASTAVTSTGIMIASQWVTTVIGWLVALVGVAVTLFLGRAHWLKGNQHELEMELMRQKHELEIALMKQKLKETEKEEEL